MKVDEDSTIWALALSIHLHCQVKSFMMLELHARSDSLHRYLRLVAKLSFALKVDTARILEP